jgi:hypothetical protein
MASTIAVRFASHASGVVLSTAAATLINRMQRP